MANSETPTLISGAKTVTTAGTRVQLVTASQRVTSLVIIAKIANTGKLFVGGDDVASTTNGGMNAADALSLPGPLDLKDVYLDVSVNGEGADFYASKV